ncbi:CBS domain-containing protein [Methanobrevibacter filiformis]|uniref:Inosine-5'-monophosphate dehydrogenase n=1 Tax=Methanobrevibacter filiformis TaxID=55758 RepID=A0A166DMB4_9EURY|nr:CBS domain-containing protein [Methanobrevibacter filiformis]KZX15751.1 inosine-5'-monophosphate dehydrogenase [Methanobrevibacter filiformis]
MLTPVQKEILQALINLYQTSNGNSIKGEDIANIVRRNPGTIRNQMQSLRNLNLVKGVPGPRGGYKPTIEAYHTLNISVADNESKVPISIKGNELKDISVARIEFASIPHPGECEAVVKVLGNIKGLNIGDNIVIGPTPVNKLGISGVIVGRDDMDNIVLLDTKTIRSIPKKTVIEVASLNIISINHDQSTRDVAKVFSDESIEGAPVFENDNIIGIITVNDVVKAIANSKEDLSAKDIMSGPVIKVKSEVMISEAIDIMHSNNFGRLVVMDDNKLKGIITRTDIIDTITTLD